MIRSTRFALARYAPRMMRQKGEILEFHAAGIRVWKGDQVVAEWPYSAIRRLLYKHFPGGLSRTFQLLSGNLLQRRDAVFSVEMEGKREEFYLEADAEFRQTDLRELMRDLYVAGVNLEEYAATGNRLFLLESASGMDLAAAVAALSEENKSDT